MMLTLPPDYTPSDSEEFMNPLQVEYFRQKLLRWRADLLRDADDTLASLGQGGILEADITDRASVETDRALELRTRTEMKPSRSISSVICSSRSPSISPGSKAGEQIRNLKRRSNCISKHP